MVNFEEKTQIFHLFQSKFIKEIPTNLCCFSDFGMKSLYYLQEKEKRLIFYNFLENKEKFSLNLSSLYAKYPEFDFFIYDISEPKANNLFFSGDLVKKGSDLSHLPEKSHIIFVIEIAENTIKNLWDFYEIFIPGEYDDNRYIPSKYRILNIFRFLDISLIGLSLNDQIKVILYEKNCFSLCKIENPLRLEFNELNCLDNKMRGLVMMREKLEKEPEEFQLKDESFQVKFPVSLLALSCDGYLYRYYFVPFKDEFQNISFFINKQEILTKEIKYRKKEEKKEEEIIDNNQKKKMKKEEEKNDNVALQGKNTGLFQEKPDNNVLKQEKPENSSITGLFDSGSNVLTLEKSDNSSKTELFGSSANNILTQEKSDKSSKTGLFGNINPLALIEKSTGLLGKLNTQEKSSGMFGNLNTQDKGIGIFGNLNSQDKGKNLNSQEKAIGMFGNLTSQDKGMSSVINVPIAKKQENSGDLFQNTQNQGLFQVPKPVSDSKLGENLTFSFGRSEMTSQSNNAKQALNLTKEEDKTLKTLEKSKIIQTKAEDAFLEKKRNYYEEESNEEEEEYYEENEENNEEDEEIYEGPEEYRGLYKIYQELIGKARNFSHEISKIDENPILGNMMYTMKEKPVLKRECKALEEKVKKITEISQVLKNEIEKTKEFYNEKKHEVFNEKKSEIMKKPDFSKENPIEILTIIEEIINKGNNKNKYYELLSNFNEKHNEFPQALNDLSHKLMNCSENISILTNLMKKIQGFKYKLPNYEPRKAENISKKQIKNNVIPFDFLMNVSNEKNQKECQNFLKNLVQKPQKNPNYFSQQFNTISPYQNIRKKVNLTEKAYKDEEKNNIFQKRSNISQEKSEKREKIEEKGKNINVFEAHKLFLEEQNKKCDKILSVLAENTKKKTPSGKYNLEDFEDSEDSEENHSFYEKNSMENVLYVYNMNNQQGFMRNLIDFTQNNLKTKNFSYKNQEKVLRKPPVEEEKVANVKKPEETQFLNKNQGKFGFETQKKPEEISKTFSKKTDLMDIQEILPEEKLAKEKNLKKNQAFPMNLSNQEEIFVKKSEKTLKEMQKIEEKNEKTANNYEPTGQKKKKNISSDNLQTLFLNNNVPNIKEKPIVCNEPIKEVNKAKNEQKPEIFMKNTQNNDGLFKNGFGLLAPMTDSLNPLKKDENKLIFTNPKENNKPSSNDLFANFQPNKQKTEVNPQPPKDSLFSNAQPLKTNENSLFSNVQPPKNNENLTVQLPKPKENLLNNANPFANFQQNEQKTEVNPQHTKDSLFSIAQPLKTNENPLISNVQPPNNNENLTIQPPKPKENLLNNSISSMNTNADNKPIETIINNKPKESNSLFSNQPKDNQQPKTTLSLPENKPLPAVNLDKLTINQPSNNGFFPSQSQNQHINPLTAPSDEQLASKQTAHSSQISFPSTQNTTFPLNPIFSNTQQQAFPQQNPQNPAFSQQNFQFGGGFTQLPQYQFGQSVFGMPQNQMNPAGFQPQPIQPIKTQQGGHLFGKFGGETENKMLTFSNMNNMNSGGNAGGGGGFLGNTFSGMGASGNTNPNPQGFSSSFMQPRK